MNQNTPSAPPVVVWLLGGMVFLLALLALWIGFFKGPNLTSQSSTLQVAPVSTAGGAQVPDDAPIAEVAVPAPAQAQPALAPEQTVVVTGAAASGGLRVRADANQDAPVLEVYVDDTVLTILDPSGDYSTYPVQNNGTSWYRVRDQNGLVSWADGQFLSPAGQ
ncbi:MAG: SH3 domain-containing protein [Caldilineaceae bacterium]|nr:SH3 domain-containing protein [Caldilineaceae bacterium]MCB0143789.1 SH3 domain-containing protein [Caldilineaceae bacterium]